MERVLEDRIHTIQEAEFGDGPIIYWMQRDARAHDNWALLYAQDLAIMEKKQLLVLYVLDHDNKDVISKRQTPFLLEGLSELSDELKKYQIGFQFYLGSPPKIVTTQAKNAAALVTDFNPLSYKQRWLKNIKIKAPIFEVDAHNCVPIWVASSKQEYGAYTLRPKIKKYLNSYLEEFPKLQKHPLPWKGKMISPKAQKKTFMMGGEKAAQKALSEFISKKLTRYGSKRNDPTEDAQSNLSPYLHFGMLSPARAALAAKKSSSHGKDEFLEELIIRRELSDNYCYYNKNYDSCKGFPEWATKTLNAHKKDKREYCYTKAQFEKAKTHDPLWNAAPNGNGTKGKNAWLYADVLGQKNTRMEQKP